MEKVFGEGVLLHLYIRRWPGKVSLNPEDLGLDPKVIPEEFSLGEKYLVPKKALFQLRNLEQRARRVIEVSSFRFPVGNMPFVPMSILSEVTEELDHWGVQYNKAADELVERFNDLIRESRTEFVKVAGQIWDQTQRSRPEPRDLEEELEDAYDLTLGDMSRGEFIKRFLARIKEALPRNRKILRDKYSFTYMIYTIRIPESGEEISAQMMDAEMMRRYRTEATTQIRGFIDEVVTELRQRTYEVCTHVAGLITEGKVVREASLDTLRVFVDQFEKLNFPGDTSIGKQLSKLRRDYLHQGREIRDSETLREEFRDSLEAVATSAAEHTDISRVTGKLKRRLEL